MAGHSKWANIRHRKAAQDAKRGKIFTKLIRELTVAARAGGGDVATNPRLRAAVDKALSSNMKRDTVDKAIARGSGNLDGAHYEEVRYEGYGPLGVAILVDCLTDNRQRTVAEVRHAFSKKGGNLGTDGSVAYLFEHKGFLQLPLEGVDEESVLEVALENGAEDVVGQDGDVVIETGASEYLRVKEALEKVGCVFERAELLWDAEVKTVLDEASADKVIALIEMLEDLDDVQSVYSNLDIA